MRAGSFTELMIDRNLEDYPLAKVYGWRLPQRDTGGILYIYPPIDIDGRKGPGKLERHRFDAINPEDLHPAAWTAQGNMK